MSEENSLDKIKKIWPKDAPDVNNVPKYVKKYKKDLLVIKYGGNVLIDRNIFNNFIQDISILNKLGLSIIVVHGGGPRIERELKKGNIQSKFINGLRVTDKNVINIVEKVLVDFNNDIVGSLNKKGSKAVSINTKVNNIIKVIPDNPELGFVGIPQKIDINIIKNIIGQNQIPIVAPLGLDDDNQTYNINGDTAASAIAKKLKSRRLLLMTNVEGVYDDQKKLIEEIKPYDMENLVNLKIVKGGMLPKIKNCIDAVENGVRGVVILDGRKPRSILKEIFSDQGAGTLIRK
tara:strand:- start:1149 stop:2018 length:870 start_codon:yes stop_codon:yes gene_type:complete